MPGLRDLGISPGSACRSRDRIPFGLRMPMTLGSSITALRSLTGPGGGSSDGGCLPVAIGMTGLPTVLLFLADLDAGIADGGIDCREREGPPEDVGDGHEPLVGGPVSGRRPRQRSPSCARTSHDTGVSPHVRDRTRLEVRLVGLDDGAWMIRVPGSGGCTAADRRHRADAGP